MLNVPITDTLAVRVAGAMTKREGFDYNTFTQQRINGRDLWSTRASVQWEPSDRFKVNAIWQHFEEDDNRSRTGRSEEHTSELQSLMRISYAVFCLKKKKTNTEHKNTQNNNNMK